MSFQRLVWGIRLLYGTDRCFIGERRLASDPYKLKLPQQTITMLRPIEVENSEPSAAGAAAASSSAPTPQEITAAADWILLHCKKTISTILPIYPEATKPSMCHLRHKGLLLELLAPELNPTSSPSMQANVKERGMSSISTNRREPKLIPCLLMMSYKFVFRVS